MLTLITGVPGSGKSLYVVEKLIPPMLTASVDVIDDDNNKTSHERVVYTNIKRLDMEHSLIDDHSLNSWHTWAKPGAFIVFDEVQKVWPQRAVGSKVPDYISALETHRHMGVDIVLITQGVHLIDRNLIPLIGRHLHVRRVGNMNLAIVYEWDHCSRTLQYKSSMAKKPWRYNKKTFGLYRSADAHTKQPRSAPAVLYGIGLALLAFVYLGHNFYGRFTEKAFGTANAAPVVQATKLPQNPLLPSNANLSTLPSPASTNPLLTPSLALLPVSRTVLLSGCMMSKSKCSCFDDAGYKVTITDAACHAAIHELGASVPIAQAPSTVAVKLP
jgi:zona occludens toxin